MRATIITSIVEAFGKGLSKFVEIGGQLVSGLWEGIKNAGSWLWDKITGFFGGIVDGIKGFFGIHSPSTLFRDQIGKNLALGIGAGFSNEMNSVAKDMQDAIPTGFDTDVQMTASMSNAGFGSASGVPGGRSNPSPTTSPSARYILTANSILMTWRTECPTLSYQILS